MIQEICKDEKFLAQKAEQATPDDIQTATDLLETLEAHKDGCVGMAANMIGVNKRIIAFDNEGNVHGDVQPRRSSSNRGGYDGRGGLPVADRHAQNAPLAIHQGAVSERKVPDDDSKPSPAGPRRSSSMKSTTATASSYKGNKQKRKPTHTKRHAKRRAFSRSPAEFCLRQAQAGQALPQ